MVGITQCLSSLIKPFAVIVTDDSELEDNQYHVTGKDPTVDVIECCKSEYSTNTTDIDYGCPTHHQHHHTYVGEDQLFLRPVGQLA